MSEALRTDAYLCTDCCVVFVGPEKRADNPCCPKCGESYQGFFTKIMRAGSFAACYWAQANPEKAARVVNWKAPVEPIEASRKAGGDK